MTDKQPATSRLGRTIKIAAAVIGALIVLPLIAIPIVAYAVDLGGIVHGKVLELKPQIEEKLGRQLDIGDVKLKLLPSIAVELHDIAIHAAPGQTGAAAEPLFTLSSVRVGVAAWPLLTSLGKQVRIAYIEADHPHVVVVRFSDGKLSYEDILDKLAEEPAQPKKPMTPEQLEYIRGINASRIAMTSAALRFVELGPDGVALPAITIDPLDIVATDVGIGHPFTVLIDAAALAPSNNVHFEAELGPIPDDLQISNPVALVRSAAVRIQPLEIQPLLRFLPSKAGSLGLERARIDADLKLVTAIAAGGSLHLSGSVGAGGLTLVRHDAEKRLGIPADIRIKADLELEELAGTLAAKSLELDVDTMSITGNADVRKLWTAPEVHSLALASKDLTLDRIISLLPPGELPPKTDLRGPISLRASGSGSPTDASVELVVDLVGANVFLPQLHKPAGTALRLEFKGQVKPGGIDVSRLGLALGVLELWAHGHVKSPKDLDLQLDEGHFELDPLLRLLPTVEAEVPANVKLGGTIHLSGSAARHGESLDATIKIGMRDANAVAPSLALGGSADLAATVKTSPGSAKIDANLDLTSARIKVVGSVDKAAGVPMQLRIDVDTEGKLVTVRDAFLLLPGSKVEAKGSANLASHQLDLHVPLCDLDLAKLGAVLPMLHGGILPTDIANSRLKFAVALDGDPAQLSTVHAKLTDLQLTSSGPTLHGQAEILGVDEPRKITFDFEGAHFDLDRLMGSGSPKTASAAAPAATPASESAPVVPKMLKHLSLDGKLKLASGRFQAVNFTDLTAHITMENGKATFQALHVGALGGTISADNTTFDFAPAQPHFGIRAKLNQVDIGEVIALRSPEMAKKLDGHASLDLSADGNGLRWKDIAPKVAGQLGMLIANGHVQTASIGSSVVGPLLSRVSALNGQVKVNNEALVMRDLAGHFAIANGQLKTQQPIKFASTEGAIELNGAIGLDQSLALTGTIQLAPQLISLATAGRLVPHSPLPVDLRIGGTLASPKIEMGDPSKTVTALAAMLLQDKGKQLLEGALKNASLGGVGNQLGGVAGQILGGGQAPAAAPGKAAAPNAQQQIQKQAEDQLGKGLKGIFGQ